MGVVSSTPNGYSGPYSVEVERSPNPERFSGIYRNASHPNEIVKTFPDENYTNSWQLFMRGCKKNPDGPCLGFRKTSRKTDEGSPVEGTGHPFLWYSYQEVKNLSLRVAAGIMSQKLVPEQQFPEEPFEGSRKMRLLGIFAKNRVEWFVLEQACNAANITLVPLYDTLGTHAISYILAETEMETVAISADLVPSLEKALDFLAPEQRKLKNLILLDEKLNDGLVEACRKKHQLGICYYRDLATHPGPDFDPQPSIDGTGVSTLCYTSGTTGTPKGVILTQSAFAANVIAVLRGPLTSGLDVDHNDIHLSYLPLAHVFERSICNILFALGAAVGIYGGDTLKLLDDLRDLKPTIFISVPRLFCRINDKVFNGVKEKNALAQMLFNRGVHVKLNKLRQEGACTHSFWDRVVFNKTRALMGGNLRYMLVGGAPCDARVQEHIKLLFSAPLCEGFGLTETLGTSFISHPNDPVAGHVGGAVPCIEFRLESVSEMNYLVTSNPPRGELLVRGTSLSRGYFRNPSETEASFDSEGWFHTGDVVVLLPNGALKIIDRRKNIFKLAQGEYVVPERIEGVYQQAPLVAQVFVHGDPMETSLVGIVVPEVEEMQRWVKARSGASQIPSLQEVCKWEDFKQALWAQLRAAESQAGLKGFEKLKQITVHHELFTVENGLLTPTFKLKRHTARALFQAQIQAMYAQLGEK